MIDILGGEGYQLVSPTETQAYGLAMTDFIHPICKVSAQYNSNYNDYTNVILDSGTRGSGKTDKAIWEMKGEIDKGFGNEWTGIVFRRTYNDLEDFINKADRFFGMLGYDYVVKRGNGARIKFKNGSQIMFRIMITMEDYNRYHGAEYQFILFEEGTLWFEIMDLVYQMMSCLRSPYNQKYANEIKAGKKKPMILKMRITTNPFGSGLLQLKRVFVDNRNLGEAFIIDGITYIHFLSTFLDNPYIKDSYANNFKNISNKAKRDAWLYAKWNCKTSGAFGDLWDDATFLLPKFKVPKQWKVTRSMDWGKREPFSILWWSESDGSTPAKMIRNGKEIEFCPPEGTLILILEWYGCTEEGNNKGLGLRVSEVAEGIHARDSMLRKDVLDPNCEIIDGAGDYSIYNDIGTDYTIGDIFEQNGIYWKYCKKDRVMGVNMMLEIMQNTLEHDHDRRHIYVVGSEAPFWIENVMSLEYSDTNPEDVKTKGVCDHDFDATKYMVMDIDYIETQTNER
jgi:hypothetical protein